MIHQGREIFRFDTFGDQAFWGGQLKVHQAINKLTPQNALALGLKVDAEVSKGQIGLVAVHALSCGFNFVDVYLLNLGGHPGFVAGGVNVSARSLTFTSSRHKKTYRVYTQMISTVCVMPWLVNCSNHRGATAVFEARREFVRD